MTTQLYLEPAQAPTQATRPPLTAYQAALRLRMICAASTLAQQQAINAVKAALRAKGLKLSEFSHREVCVLAEEYAERHGEELVTEALATIERRRTKGHFGKRRKPASRHRSA